MIKDFATRWHDGRRGIRAHGAWRTFVFIGLALAAALGAGMPAGAQEARIATLADMEKTSSYDELGRRLEARIGEMDWGDGQVGIAVEDADYAITACAKNADTPFNPAGVAKAVTAAAALETLGADFRFTTELRVAGRIDHKRLKGAIVVRGDGDPSITAQFLKDADDVWEPLDRWAKLIRRRGIREVDGPVVGDGSAFDDQLYGPGWPVNRIGEETVPPVSALNFNGNCFDIYWQEGKKDGEIARYRLFPELPGFLFFANNVRLRARAIQDRTYSRMNDGNLVNAEGELALKTAAHDRAAIKQPATYFAEALRTRLVQKGVKVTGRAGSTADLSPGEYPAESELVDTLQSPPLLALLREMMSRDLPLTAETAFKALGRRSGGEAASAGMGGSGPVRGSFAGGSRAVGQYLGSLRLPGRPSILLDGSGLSAMNRMTPRQVACFLRRAGERPTGEVFKDLFARPGDAGALEGRFAQRAEDAGRFIRAKNGSGEGIETLAGWATSATGRRVVFAIMVRDSHTPPAVLRSQIDELVLEMTH
ncbi:MAG: D-alanyl-D-alanine carboxypeptidase/D-alanyl-D-alanine-endopeptidase [bacterium]|nr:D-alanyl-D-alanine carboxypeptidase/D-alanyl-D-alanine-endopeptidase [bacterium]